MLEGGQHDEHVFRRHVRVRRERIGESRRGGLVAAREVGDANGQRLGPCLDLLEGSRSSRASDAPNSPALARSSADWKSPSALGGIHGEQCPVHVEGLRQRCRSHRSPFL